MKITHRGVDAISQIVLFGTFVQLALANTRAWASINPKPNLGLNHNPSEFLNHPGLSLKK